MLMDDIPYVTRNGQHTYIHTVRDDSIKITATLKAVAEKLPEKGYCACILMVDEAATKTKK